MSQDLEFSSVIFKHVLFHADPKGNTRGSKNPRQADNTLVSRNKLETGFRPKEDLEKKFL